MEKLKLSCKDGKTNMKPTREVGALRVGRVGSVLTVTLKEIADAVLCKRKNHFINNSFCCCGGGETMGNRKRKTPAKRKRSKRKQKGSGIGVPPPFIGQWRDSPYGPLVRVQRRRQKGGALARHKVRLVDKIAEGAAMGLSGPSPSFLKLLGKLGGQAVKGIKDNVSHYKKGRR